MHKIHVKSQTPYPVYIGENLLSNAELLNSHIQNHMIMIVSDPTVSDLYMKQLKTALGSRPYNVVLIPEGEQYKTLETWQQILEALFLHAHTRYTTLIALGGGVVGDISGFAAACYQRGIPWIQIPTTLLAQIDASIGGKTGINHSHGKNMIGAFHQPSCVIIDINLLNSLPQRHYSAGLAELIKYGLIYDPAFFAWLETHMEACIQREPAIVSQAIQRACEIKATIVESDEKEIIQKRAILNFGHTFGHAIENILGYGNLLHGEAVAIGMVMATALSVQVYGLSETVLVRIKKILQQAQLPIKRPAILETEQIIHAMRKDKKNQDDTLRLILLKNIGKPIITDTVPITCIKRMIQEN